MSEVCAEASAYEQVTRQKVRELKDDLEEYKRRVNGSLEKIDRRLSAIENKLNARPTWAIAVILTGLCSLCSALITYLVTSV